MQTPTDAAGKPLTKNQHLLDWVDEMARLTKPDHVVWCDGSDEERHRLTEETVAKGILTPLSSTKLPNCFIHRSNPNDVARVEQLTFICTPTQDEAGPTNNWMAPADAYTKLTVLFDGSMNGRTMYVIPYVMGPVGSVHSKVGLELTDSPYVVLNMRIMTRMGRPALNMLGASNDFNRGLHSMLDVNPERRFICHFPQDNTIWSVGSGYGGNVLLGKKCLALRVGSYLGLRERLRQDELRDDDPAQALQGLEDLDRGRRHRLDARQRRRPPLRGEPGERLLRRRPGHQRDHQPERHGDRVARHDLHQRRDHERRQRLVGGHGWRGPRRADRLDGQAVEERLP